MGVCRVPRVVLVAFGFVGDEFLGSDKYAVGLVLWFRGFSV